LKTRRERRRSAAACLAASASSSSSVFLTAYPTMADAADAAWVACTECSVATGAGSFVSSAAAAAIGLPSHTNTAAAILLSALWFAASLEFASDFGGRKKGSRLRRRRCRVTGPNAGTEQPPPPSLDIDDDDDDIDDEEDDDIDDDIDFDDNENGKLYGDAVLVVVFASSQHRATRKASVGS
jgi:hypothetical protein